MAISTTLESGIDGTLGTRRRSAASTLTSTSAGATTYFYRTSAGARGSTTDLGAIPALAVIERTVTA